MCYRVTSITDDDTQIKYGLNDENEMKHENTEFSLEFYEIHPCKTNKGIKLNKIQFVITENISISIFFYSLTNEKAC